MEEKPKKKRAPRKPKKNSLPEESFDIDPRRSAFALAFYNPTSDTYGKIQESGIKAGFTSAYAKNIMTNKPDWICRIVEKMGLVDTVKKNIKKHLELKTVVPVMTAFGPYIDKKTKKMVMHEDPKLLKIQGDMTMFVAEKLIPEYKRDFKLDPTGLTVEIKQIILMPQNAQERGTINSRTNGQAIPRLSEAS